jgi:hypothetical protein
MHCQRVWPASPGTPGHHPFQTPITLSSPVSRSPSIFNAYVGCEGAAVSAWVPLIHCQPSALDPPILPQTNFKDHPNFRQWHVNAYEWFWWAADGAVPVKPGLQTTEARRVVSRYGTGLAKHKRRTTPTRALCAPSAMSFIIPDRCDRSPFPFSPTCTAVLVCLID